MNALYLIANSLNPIKHLNNNKFIFKKKICINPISFRSIIIKDTNFVQNNTHTHWKIQFSINHTSIYTHPNPIQCK